MSDVPASRPAESADDVLAGVLDLAVVAPLALGAFASISAVEWSSGIETACVECAQRPRLLLNPDFVAERCGTRERLAMLLLHELSHISLGHTGLYPRVTPAHNIAFDALINARLLDTLRRLGIDPGPYAALPCSYYRPDESPLFILRPPPGWPVAPDWLASSSCPEVLREIHRRLYAVHDRALNGVTYGEIVLALCGSGLAGSGEGAEALLRRLLGAHGNTPEETAALSSGRDAAIAELFARTLTALANADPGRGWGPPGEPGVLEIERHRAERRLQQALAGLLKRVFAPQRGRTRRHTTSYAPILSVDPSHDRRAAARRLLAERFGAPRPLLFDSHIVERRPDRTAAAIYLDVSGSMNGLIERLHAALVPLHRLLAPEVFAFSCGVDPSPVADFVRGRLSTSWGTDITPVLRHAAGESRGGAAAMPALRPARALVLTDGYFAAPEPAAVNALLESRVELHVAIIGDGPLPVGSWVASATRLPAPPPSRD